MGLIRSAMTASKKWQTVEINQLSIYFTFLSQTAHHEMQLEQVSNKPLGICLALVLLGDMFIGK